MGLQIGNSKVKEVKIGEIGTSTDYTFTNQPDFTLESQGAYRGVRLIDPFELNSRIKGTLTFSVSKQYDVYMQQSDGTMKYSSVTGNVINFDAYCVNTSSHAVRLYWKASDGIQALSCDIFFNLTNPVLQMSLNVNFDYIKDTVTLNLTNFQYGTIPTTPTVSYHNIKEIYVGSNKVFPVKQTGWVTAWEGNFTYTTTKTGSSVTKIVAPNLFDNVSKETKLRMTGTVKITSGYWKLISATYYYGNYIYYGNDPTYITNPNSNVIDLSNIEFYVNKYAPGAGSNYELLTIETSKGASFGMKGYFKYSWNDLVFQYDTSTSYAIPVTFNITKIEAYVPE